jgi:hypothetical protein
MSRYGKLAVETLKQMLQHHQHNSETFQITSCNIATSRFILQLQHEIVWDIDLES